MLRRETDRANQLPAASRERHEYKRHGGSIGTNMTPGRTLPGLAVDVGNRHLVCALDDTDLDLAALDLAVAPGHDPVVFPRGVNVEFTRSLGADELRMRVHERGVGETRSCGTGTVAAVAAALHRAGRAAAEVTVHIPGGTAVVGIAENGEATLAGPAVLVATGEISAQWWADLG